MVVVDSVIVQVDLTCCDVVMWLVSVLVCVCLNLREREKQTKEEGRARIFCVHPSAFGFHSMP